MNFDHFQNINECYKKVHFLQFWADLSQKPKCVKAIYIYGYEIFNYSLSENDMPYRGLNHCSY